MPVSLLLIKFIPGSTYYPAISLKTNQFLFDNVSTEDLVGHLAIDILSNADNFRPEATVKDKVVFYVLY